MTPFRLTVFGLRVTVKSELLDGDTHAEWDDKNNTVKIDPRAPNKHEKLAHELMHVMLGRGGLAELLTGEQQEAACTAAEGFGNHVRHLLPADWE